MGLKHIVDEHYAGMNSGSLEGIVSPLADDVVTLAPGARMEGIEQFKPFVQAFITAFPGATIEAKRTWESGDTIVAEGVYRGTHSGPMVGAAGTIPPTGKNIALEFTDVFKVRDGKAVEHRIYFDQGELMQQLGLMPRG